MNVRNGVRAVNGARRAFTNWLPFLGRIATASVRGAPAATCVRTRGGTTICCPNTPMARAPLWEVFAFDDYPWPLLVEGLKRADPVVVDVGAHVGAFTLGLQERRPDVRAICFEPSSETYGFLERNIASNQRGGVVEVHPEAVADVAGPIAFWEAEAGSCENSSVPIPGASQRTVDAVTLDAVVEACASEVDLLKLDCEGAEHGIIPATADRTWSRISSIFLEYHPVPESGWSTLRPLLEANGFRVRWERSDLNGVPGLGLAYLSREQ